MRVCLVQKVLVQFLWQQMRVNIQESRVALCCDFAVKQLLGAGILFCPFLFIFKILFNFLICPLDFKGVWKECRCYMKCLLTCSCTILVQGGDLIKWDKASIGYYVGIDIADGSVCQQFLYIHLPLLLATLLQLYLQILVIVVWMSDCRL